jgi:peptidoglycan/xylan/chitin deacetylase (PgdA/CDA1 family)
MKNILITLDYELFFGGDSGTVDNCMLRPTKKLLEVLDRQKVKATFFIDSGYLVKSEAEQHKSSELKKEYQEVLAQIKRLDAQGHSIQLHIHPHWEDSYHNGFKWIMDTSRYKLHDFSEVEIESIVYRYKKALTDIVPNEIFAHRAGGWCIQPFSKLYKALKQYKLWLDSTVFTNGKNDSKTHYFNFENTPKKAEWNFESDPLIEDEKGFFKELPIASYQLLPSFFWKLIFVKKFGNKEHHNFGDGKAAGGSTLDKLRMLILPTSSVVSIDGYKSSFLEKAFQLFSKTKDNKTFVIIGHPKSMSEYSLKKLEEFIIKNRSCNFETIRSFENEF